MIQNHLTFKVPFLKRGFNNITDILETLSFLRNRRERSQTTSLITIYSSTRFRGHRQEFFFNLENGEKEKSTKTSEKDHTIWALLKKPHSSYEPQLTQHWKKHAPTTQPKTLLTFQIFQQATGWCQKKHLHWTISGRPRTAFSKHFESKCLYISVYLRKKFFIPEI